MSSTQVILLERVEKLGNMGDVVNVKPGFARNYLLPQKKALRASKDNIAYFEAQKKHIQAESDKMKKEAEKLLPKLDEVKIPLIRQASESGQLYGSVTARDIATQIKDATGVAIERSKILVNQNYKQIGLFPVEVLLHPEVKAVVTVNIARSQEEADIQAETGRAVTAEIEEEAVEGIIADEAALEDVLEEGALEAEKEKQAAAEAEEQAKAEEAARKAEEKAAKEAEEAEKAAAEEAEASESKEATEEASEEEKKEDE